MSASACLRFSLPLIALLLVMACSLTPAGPTPQPFRTLDPANRYLGPTLSAVGQNRPSPGGWIAFIRDGNLWMIHPDGSGLKQVTQDGAGDVQLSWSADGQLLAYSQGGSLTVLNMAGLSSNVIARDTAGGFDWSATAHELIYDTAPASGEAAGGGLRVISADGSAGRPLNAPAAPVMLHPLWSFDSRRVLFTTPRSSSPHLLDAATGVVSDLLPGASAETSCSWSPVELLIACLDGNPPASGTAALLIFDKDGKQQRSLALPSGYSHARLGPWSPDGGRLSVSYASGPDGYDEASDILSLDAGSFKKLAAGRIVTWSPDGRWVVMDGSPAGSQSLMVVNTGSGLGAPLADGTSPAWQPAANEQLSVPGAKPAPGSDDYCLDASAGFVHMKPKGYYLQFCIGAEKYNYGALADGVYIVGPETRFFVYASNSGFAFAARMGDATLTRIGDFRWFRVFQLPNEPDPKLELRFINGYPALVQVFELRFSQKDTFTLPHRVFTP